MLAAVFYVIMIASFMVGTIRYVQEPPGVDCTKVAAENGFDLYSLAYIEYKERVNVTFTNPRAQFDSIVSRSGYYVCFCDSMLSLYERDPYHFYYFKYTDTDGTLNT